MNLSPDLWKGGLRDVLLLTIAAGNDYGFDILSSLSFSQMIK